MRRQSQEECCKNGNILRSRVKKKRSWFKSIRNMADNVVNGGETRLSSATDDSQDVSSNHGSERVKVRQYGKSWKELTGLYMNQEIHAHSGSIWTIKFSLDGRHLATAGEDCVIHVWKVVESERKRDFMEDMENEGYFNQISTVTNNGSPESIDSEKMRRAKLSDTRKSFSHLAADHVIVPDTLFELSDKPVCSFVGHQEDVLDLSWSKSKLLLSSSMDRTVRLWDMSTDGCLKTFVHSDYVTCIHFNPVDDRYFISGSIDAMVRLWSIEHNQVVDWDDLHEMVTAACYTPNGQGAFVGSHKGDCNFYNISDNKLQEKIQVNLKNKKNKLHMKRITGFQFGLTSSQVLITSADPQIRVIDELDLLLVHKFKGFRNKCSQISASITSDGNHVVCASDSQVYIWRYDVSATPSRNKAHSVTCTRSYEYFHCRGASIAVSWTGGSKSNNMTNSEVSSPSYKTTKAADHQKSMDTRNLFDDASKSKEWLDDRTEEELEELEDDADLDDDRFLEEYRKKRLMEIKAAAKVARFGSVVPISGSDFVREVSQAPADVWVVVLLYKDGIADCGVLLRCLEELATRYPATKFVKIVSTDCIPNYPDRNVPTVLVYNNSAVKATHLGLLPFGYKKCTPESVALVLCQSDPVLNDGQSEGSASVTGVQKRFIEKVMQEHLDDNNDYSSDD